jgi:hypothetical protein
VRRKAKQGIYDDAIARTHALCNSIDVRAPLVDGPAAAPPSDISAELASAARRI